MWVELAMGIKKQGAKSNNALREVNNSGATHWGPLMDRRGRVLGWELYFAMTQNECLCSQSVNGQYS